MGEPRGRMPYLHRTTGRLHCHEWKHHLDESLAFHHVLKQRSRDGEIITTFQKTVESLKERSSVCRLFAGATTVGPRVNSIVRTP